MFNVLVGLYLVGAIATFIYLMTTFIDHPFWRSANALERLKALISGCIVWGICALLFPATWLILLSARDSEVL